MGDAKYDSFMGYGPKKIAHWETWACPDAETYLTGIDYYEHPKLCRERLQELYPQLDLPIPPTDEPKPRPQLDLEGQSSSSERHTVRWGDGETSSWEHGVDYFHSPEEVFAFSPLEHADFSDISVMASGDFSSEEGIYQRYRQNYPEEWGDKAPAGSSESVGFYNTMFMWPLLTFGWELFLECCLDPRFERVMDEFAEINRRVFGAFARLPVNFVVCHDDIVMSRGPVCSPEWMHKYIFPRYEEFWGHLKEAGKEVLFIADGCLDRYVDDVIACGARGILCEPYTDYKAIARRYDNPFLAGEGDARILMRNNPEEIRRMVESMIETGKMSGGYMMCIGNNIPWNIPPEAIKYYLDLSVELAYR